MNMSLPVDQIDELLHVYPNVKQANEAGVTYFFLPQLALPAGCSPSHTDALLCPTPRDGYVSRLYFSEMIAGGPSRNWNPQGIARILDRNWHAISWQTSQNLRLVQMIRVHLDALRNK